MNELEGMINSVLSNPDEMKKIMDMANSLMSGSEKEPPPQEAPPGFSGAAQGADSITPEMGAAVMKLIQGLGKGESDKHRLLHAMQPYLSEQRRAKLARAMQLSRMLSAGLGLLGKNGGLL